MGRETGRIKPGAIVIARHGLPDCDRMQKVDWRGYRDWWADYDRAGLAPGQTPPAELIAAAQAADVIFASTLPRACETAKAVAGERPVVCDAVFVEAPLPPPRIPGRMRARDWGGWARLAWWLGDHKDMESRPEAELRAQAAVAVLTARALRGEAVLLCAHGWFNRMMRPVLLRQGWRCVHDGGDHYWSHRRYERAP